jgi:hypothetical protein
MENIVGMFLASFLFLPLLPFLLLYFCVHKHLHLYMRINIYIYIYIYTRVMLYGRCYVQGRVAVHVHLGVGGSIFLSPVFYRGKI